MKRFLLILFCVALLSGCSSQIGEGVTQTNNTNNPSVSTTTIVQDPTESHATIATTVPETVPPIKSLGIDSGAHLLQYRNEISGKYMDYYLFVPNNATVDMPLVVFLHKIHEVGQPEMLKSAGIVNRVKEIYGEDFPFLLLLPCTRIQSWSLNDVPYTRYELIESVASTYESDRDHIIITGHSLGSIGTWKMVSLYGDYFSAAVPVSCGTNEELDYDNFISVPVWGFAGTSGYEEQMYCNAMKNIVSAINNSGGNAIITVLDGATHLDTGTQSYTQELFDWMLSQ